MMKKWDWLLLCSTVGIAVIMYFAMKAFGTEGAYVLVTVDGTETARYALSEEIEEDVQGGNAGYVHLVIHNGVADVTKASCPDYLCVHQAQISKTGETIVCLPNRIVIQIIGTEKETMYDAVTN